MNHVLDHTEHEIVRFNYSAEMLFVKNVKEGNPDALREAGQTVSIEEFSVGKLAKKSLKLHEYLACSIIVLASRAAIDGGIDPLTSYLKSDLYFQRLENCADIKAIYSLVFEVAIDYAELVSDYLIQKSHRSYVEQCKHFIRKRINKPFSNDEVAKELSISKHYLSRLFAEEVGMGIQQYAVRERLEAAKNMLKFSDQEISTIAMYLCFASQSYFGKLFKKHTGYTPKQFRDKYKTLDFK